MAVSTTLPDSARDELGDALGLSHDSVRKRAKRAAEAGISAPGVSVPARAQTLYVIPTRELHADIAADLTARLAAAMEGSEERTSTGIKPAGAHYSRALHAAREAGWDEYSIAEGLGGHPKAVFKFIGQHARQGGDVPTSSYPTAPPEHFACCVQVTTA